MKNELDNNESILLNRTDEVAQIYSYIEKRVQTIHPPKNKLTLHVRRDVGEYPYFEDIVSWAESLQFFNFGHIHASTSFDNSNSDKERTYSSNLSIAEMVQELSDDSKSKVINTFNEFGYELTDIAPSLLKDKKEIVIKEKNMQGDILETAISQGMFRALSLLVFIQYMIDKKIITTLIIDDLCEGLDYERSSKLGRKTFDVLKENDIQTIATTNDYFLMNSIDIDYWNIFRRNNSVVTSYNKSSNLDLFKKFDFSGLMNFDLFSSNFIDKELADG